MIAEWIGAGMRAPSGDDPKILSLATYPETALLHPGSRQQVLVQAKFSDGRVEDVTRLEPSLRNTDETVAKVDDFGQVKVDGHGEAAITVWYASRVQRTTITSPFETKIDPEVYRSAPRSNPIDEKNLAKLEALKIAPSADAGDAAFLRRAYLDATGTLPPAAQVDAFLKDGDPKKRAKLVDRLLESSEFVDYWAFQMVGPVPEVSTNKLPAPAMWAFYRSVRQGVADNQRSVGSICAFGDHRQGEQDSLKNGAANYFVLLRPDRSHRELEHGMGMSPASCRIPLQPPDGEVDPGPGIAGVATLFYRGSASRTARSRGTLWWSPTKRARSSTRGRAL